MFPHIMSIILLITCYVSASSVDELQEETEATRRRRGEYSAGLSLRNLCMQASKDLLCFRVVCGMA